jgi:hypothetical protein
VVQKFGAVLPEGPRIFTVKPPCTVIPEKPRTVIPEKPRTVIPEKPRTVIPEKPRTVIPEKPRTVIPEKPRTVIPEKPRTVIPSEARDLRAHRCVKWRKHLSRPFRPRQIGVLTMKPISHWPPAPRRAVTHVLCDIDDTLTLGGRLPAAAYSAMETLTEAGLHVIPVTGRPAGWCDHIARMWPVAAVVGENGAFYFRYDGENRRMIRRYARSREARAADRRRLEEIRKRVLVEVPGCAVAADQAYREADLAIDFCEDVAPLPMDAVDRIVACFTDAGARAKISSIHVNGWFGDYDKLTMTVRLFAEVFGVTLESVRQRVVFVGDSPNDAPMFAYFPHAVGVANVKPFVERIEALPAWVTTAEGGYGFAEMAELLLAGRSET